MFMPNGEFAIRSKNCMFTDTPRSRRGNIRNDFKTDMQSRHSPCFFHTFCRSVSCANMTFYIVSFYHWGSLFENTICILTQNWNSQTEYYAFFKNVQQKTKLSNRDTSSLPLALLRCLLVSSRITFPYKSWALKIIINKYKKENMKCAFSGINKFGEIGDCL